MKYEITYSLKPMVNDTNTIEVTTDIPEEGIFSDEFKTVVEDAILEFDQNIFDSSDILIRAMKEVPDNAA